MGVGADSAFIYYLLFWLRLRFEIAFYIFKIELKFGVKFDLGLKKN